MSFLDRLKSLFVGTGQDGGGSGAPAITCEEALAVIHDFLDGELVDVSQKQVKAHFDVCQRCYPHLHLEEAFREAIRRAAAQEQAPAGLEAKVIELLAEADA